MRRISTSGIECRREGEGEIYIMRQRTTPNKQVLRLEHASVAIQLPALIIMEIMTDRPTDGHEGYGEVTLSKSKSV